MLLLYMSGKIVLLPPTFNILGIAFQVHGTSKYSGLKDFLKCLITFYADKANTCQFVSRIQDQGLQTDISWIGLS